MSFSVTLPLPPSTNRLFFNARGKGGRGRIKTALYRRWSNNAVLSIFAQVPAAKRIGGAVSLSICVPSGMRGDIDNRLKATIDALVKSNRIDDDKHVHSITILRGGADKGTIEVKATAA